MRRALGLAGSDGAAALGTPVKHVVLWIGDGMQLAHEIAYGRYRYGNDDGVTWRNGANWSKRGFCTTWDKTTYDRYAKNAADPTDAGNAAKQAPAYDRTTFLANPTLYAGIGYDVAKGGTAGYPEQATPSDAYFLTKVPLWATRILDGNGDAVTFTCTNDNNALFSVQPAVSTKGELTFTTASNKNGTATVTVTPVDARGLAGASQTFSITITPVADAPVASAVPTIGATGTVLVGARMTATAGTWSDADGDAMTVAYQWQRATSSTGANAVGIAGATSATYDLVEADRGMYVRVVVTTTDATGAVVTSASAWTAVPATGGGVASSSDDDDDGGCGNGAAGILLLGLLGILGLRRLR
jgi:hypothetical protein